MLVGLVAVKVEPLGARKVFERLEVRERSLEVSLANLLRLMASFYRDEAVLGEWN